jgi:hypothetical protein
MKLSNRLDIQLSGGAKYGDLGELKPVTLQEETLARQSMEVRGDLRAGSATSKVGFFGTPPQPQSGGWSVGATADQRSLNDSADLAQVRAVLATLLRELRRYGLLANQASDKPGS